MSKPFYKEKRCTGKRENSYKQVGMQMMMMHIFANTATNAAVLELVFIVICGLIGPRTFNVYTIIF